MSWIRVETNAGEDPKWARMAKILGLSADECYGKVSRLWGKVAEHAPEGDLSEVPDERIEEWANWKGKPGRFARAFAKECLTHGKLDAWEEHQGQLVAKARAERERKARERARTIPGPSSDNPSLRNDTERTATKYGSEAFPHDVEEDPSTGRLRKVL